MRPLTACSLAICIGYASTVAAGHGLMNSFANIEWLPAPGLTPASPWYRAEAWREAVSLWRADAPRDKIFLCEKIAREKLAELEAMIRAGDRASALIAIAQYQHYLDRALTTLAAVENASPEGVTEKLAVALLEHQYIVTYDYLDLPRDARPVALKLIESAAQAYLQLRAQLPRRTQESLFFKEEEVRWSRQQAEDADAQGL
jgi:Domain of unknown function (DUF5667)